MENLLAKGCCPGNKFLNNFLIPLIERGRIKNLTGYYKTMNPYL
jgi:hypothetical protein